MIAAFNSLIPVLLVIGLGVMLRRVNILDDQQWQGFEKLAYHVFFPAIVLHTILRIDLTTLPIGTLGAALFLTIVTMAAVLLLARPLLERVISLDGPSFTSVFQGSTRWNTFIAIGIAGQLLGDEGLALIAIAILAFNPNLNLMCVAVLARYASGRKLRPGEFVFTLLKNPFIWSTLLALTLNLIGIKLPQALMDSFDIVGRGALVGGLIAVGAGLRLTAVLSPSAAAMIATALRLLAMPALAAGYCALFGVTGSALQIAIIATSIPAATGSYLLARTMGGNAPLMAEILTLQTFVAILTMPLAFAIWI